MHLKERITQRWMVHVKNIAQKNVSAAVIGTIPINNHLSAVNITGVLISP